MTRTVVVTGGAIGIGRAIAGALAAPDTEVVITGRRVEPLQTAAKELGDHVRAVPFDAADPHQVAEARVDLPQRVDVLVNNAGGNTDLDRPGPGDDLVTLRDAWMANLETNLLSAVLVTSALEERLADDGRVINLSSIAAPHGAGGYGAAKAGLESWTSQLADRLGPRGITANSIAPGLIEDTEFFRGRLSQDTRQALVAETATGRAGTPDDVAELAAFLAAPESRHITGQVLHVNGGAHRAR